ncbi:hypothetical protein O181_021470 [Austropuccinia psidii MF-1]|uniref:Uncharacterized protein n=1 Tax=Austropuccinia psidii MF-1 TaxID=1389203 RepID=A0A9Q3CFS6_9BASI|nr:hypothetical protein [Austropuccinia psidii MF-1]
MSNQTPDSQSSGYEQLNWVLSNDQEPSDMQESQELLANHENNQIIGITDNQNGSQSNAGESQTQRSIKNFKRRINEELQIHCQKMEHEQWLKQKRQIEN